MPGYRVVPVITGPKMVDIRAESAPALGDLLDLPAGSHIYVFKSARDRKDWGRYMGLLGVAVSRGVNISCVGEW